MKVFVLLVLLITGCATVKLKNGAENVTISYSFDSKCLPIDDNKFVLGN